MSTATAQKKPKSGLPPSQIQQASAGTGKTFALSSRYLQLIVAGVDPATILATTFTRAAAGEILDRIVSRLAAAAGDDKKCVELSGQLGMSLTREQAVTQLALLMRQIHQLQVGTIDSFFYRLARASGFELGLPAEWELTDDDQLATARDQAVQHVLGQGQTASLLNLISHTEANRKISSAMESVIKEHYELFQQAPPSAWELDESRSVRPPSETEIRDLAGRMAALQISDKRLGKAVDADRELLAAGNLLDLAERTLICNAAAGSFDYYKRPLPGEVVEVYREAVELCRTAILAFNVQRNRSMYQLLDSWASRFRELQRQQGMLGFADVTRMLEGMAGDGGSRLIRRMDGAVRHLLLDEFQDTSSQQWAVVSPFSREVVRPDDSGSFFCVGDAKQSIFGWRGGVSEMFDVVRQDLGSAVGEAQPLIQSRRSAPAVIDTVNQVFENLDRASAPDDVQRAAINGWASEFGRHTTVHAKMTGSARLIQAQKSGDGGEGGKGGKGGKPTAEDNRDAVDAATIREIQRITESTDLTVGVLVRKHADAARLIFSLRQKGIACSEEGGNPLTDSVAVNVILAAFRLADYPADSVSGYLVSHSPLGKLLGLRPYVVPRDESFLLASHSAAKMLRERLQNDGYGATCLWLARPLFEQGTARERLRIELLVNQATEFDLQWSPRPADFVNRIVGLKITDPTSARVRVMTIHRSKGLEFGAVVAPMYGCQNGWVPKTPTTVYSRDPNTRQINRIMRYLKAEMQVLLPADLQALFAEYKSWQIRETLCLLYVTLTRAIRDLTVVVGPKANAGQSSPEGVLLAALATENPATNTEVIWQAGDAEWFRKGGSGDPDRATKTECQADRQFLLPDDFASKQNSPDRNDRTGRGNIWQKPSGHDASQIRTGSSLLRLSRLERQDETALSGSLTVRQRGILLHRMYQDIEWIDDRTRLPESVPENPYLPAEDRSGEGAKIVARFREQVARPNTAALLNRKQYLDYVRTNFLGRDQTLLEALSLQVKNEFPLVAAVGTRMIEGFVDRLVLVYEGDRLIAAEIIDFKTDELPAAAAGKQARHYLPQLQLYRAGLAVQLGLDPTRIHCRIAFVDPDVVIEQAGQ